MSLRAYVLVEADQSRVHELKQSLPLTELEGSRIVRAEVVTGPYDLVLEVESTDLSQLGH
jgi:hypothetical protein